MKVFKCNPTLRGLASMERGVVYETRGDLELKLDLIFPQAATAPKNTEKFPLIVFLQGSGWTKPNPDYEIPQLSRFAQAGYVVATIDHRHAKDAPGTPAFLEDTKSAIRFLRANAAKYSIDPERVCMWGTSSGGNTALLVGMTYDVPEFDVGSNLDQSSRVQLVVDVFGPADLEYIVAHYFKNSDEVEADNTFRYLAGGAPIDNLPLFRKISPQSYIAAEKELPPMLILQGDKDTMVPYRGSLRFYNAMVKAGYDVEFVKVEGGPHEGVFWSPELFDFIRSYIDVKL